MADRFPIQGGLTISREAAEKAYIEYSRSYGTEQSLDRLAERAGFGLLEFCHLYLKKHISFKLTNEQITRALHEAKVMSTLA